MFLPGCAPTSPPEADSSDNVGMVSALCPLPHALSPKPTILSFAANFRTFRDYGRRENHLFDGGGIKDLSSE